MKDENAFSQEQRPVVYLVGIGMGGEDQLTGRAWIAWKLPGNYRGRPDA